MIIELKQAGAAHGDLLNALLIALRDGVRRHKVNPEAVESVMLVAKRSDFYVVHFMIETVLKVVR